MRFQICIDIGAHLVSALSTPPPSDYAGIFRALIHLYLDIDDSRVFASLRQLDDLRAFAAVVTRLVNEG